MELPREHYLPEWNDGGEFSQWYFEYNRPLDSLNDAQLEAIAHFITVDDGWTIFKKEGREWVFAEYNRELERMAAEIGHDHFFYDRLAMRRMDGGIFLIGYFGDRELFRIAVTELYRSQYRLDFLPYEYCEEE